MSQHDPKCNDDCKAPPPEAPRGNHSPKRKYNWSPSKGLLTVIFTVAITVMGIIWANHTENLKTKHETILRTTQNLLVSCKKGIDCEDPTSNRKAFLIKADADDPTDLIPNDAQQYGTESSIKFYAVPDDSKFWNYTQQSEVDFLCSIYRDQLCKILRASNESFIGTNYIWQSPGRNHVEYPSITQSMFPYAIVRHIAPDELKKAIEYQMSSGQRSKELTNTVIDAIKHDPEGYVMQNELYLAMHMMPIIKGRLSITKLMKTDGFILLRLRIELANLTVDGVSRDTYYITQEYVILEDDGHVYIAVSSFPHAQIIGDEPRITEWWSYFLVIAE